MSRHTTALDRERMRAMFKAGTRVTEIAKKFQRSDGFVSTVVHKTEEEYKAYLQRQADRKRERRVSV